LLNPSPHPSSFRDTIPAQRAILTEPNDRGGSHCGPRGRNPTPDAIELEKYTQTSLPSTSSRERQRERDSGAEEEVEREVKREVKKRWLEEQDDMKFSHSIQFNAVPDWSSHYIAYSNLKKL